MQMAQLYQFTFGTEKICNRVNVCSLQYDVYQKGSHNKKKKVNLDFPVRGDGYRAYRNLSRLYSTFMYTNLDDSFKDDSLHFNLWDMVVLPSFHSPWYSSPLA